MSVESVEERRSNVTKSHTYIGTAGWALPAPVRDRFPGEGSNLEKYSRVFNAVEINSSFYREHGPATYERWARSTPPGFRFSVKLSRFFTQESGLRETGETLRASIDGISNLGEKWGVLLVQLPPKLEFEKLVARRFFRELAILTDVRVVVEPRHVSWGSESALDSMEELGLAKARAHPERVSITPEERSRVEPVVYYRLHGAPVVYRSAYSKSRLEGLSRRLEGLERESWVMFDNTTLGLATENALDLGKMVGATGFEPATFCSRSKRATRLRYAPTGK
jgi:uncharacterized protein YecE (DUF72 family)